MSASDFRATLRNEGAFEILLRIKCVKSLLEAIQNNPLLPHILFVIVVLVVRFEMGRCPTKVRSLSYCHHVVNSLDHPNPSSYTTPAILPTSVPSSDKGILAHKKKQMYKLEIPQSNGRKYIRSMQGLDTREIGVQAELNPVRSRGIAAFAWIEFSFFCLCEHVFHPLLMFVFFLSWN